MRPEYNPLSCLKGEGFTRRELTGASISRERFQACPQRRPRTPPSTLGPFQRRTDGRAGERANRGRAREIEGGRKNEREKCRRRNCWTFIKKQKKRGPWKKEAPSRDTLQPFHVDFQRRRDRRRRRLLAYPNVARRTRIRVCSLKLTYPASFFPRARRDTPRISSGRYNIPRHPSHPRRFHLFAISLALVSLTRFPLNVSNHYPAGHR